MIFCARTSSGVVANASSSTVSSPAAAVSCGRNPIVALFSNAICPLSGDVSPRISEKSVDLPAPFGPTNPIRLPRLTCSETSSKSARPAKDFESCETVSITESAQCSPLARFAQLLSRRIDRETGEDLPDFLRERADRRKRETGLLFQTDSKINCRIMKTLISVILLALSGITLSSCASDQPADSSTTTTTT